MDDTVGTQDRPCIIPVEAYTSAAYARAEWEKLWPKIWQVACRVEEIPAVGDYVTYDILDESIIVVRTAADTIKGFYNVCQHRGRRLTSGCGNAKRFFCRFHGWRWNIDGENTFVLDPEDWGNALNADNLRLKQVKVDCWGGWVWINMDPNCEPLRQYLEPAATLLDPYQLDKMRYRWRQWLYFPCNWKTSLEAFNESYHTSASHPELMRWGGDTIFWSRAQGRHGWHGSAGQRGRPSKPSVGMPSVRGGSGGVDPRTATAEALIYLMESVNATTTETLVNAAKRLVHELPPGTPPEQVGAHLIASAKRDDAARGVVWPEIDPAQMTAAGFDWHVFPNTVIIQQPTSALCYRARPNGYNPDSCIFEVYVLERFPEGEEPKTQWVFQPEPSEENWLKILSQDFQNMPEVQRGMKSRGFMGARPSPVQEKAVTNFHRSLAEFMGTGAPVEIK